MLSGAESSDADAEIAGNSRVVVLVPCYNEEAVIGKVVADFLARPDAGTYCGTKIPPIEP